MKVKKYCKSLISYILIFLITLGSFSSVGSVKSYAVAMDAFPVGQFIYEFAEYYVDLGKEFSEDGTVDRLFDMYKNAVLKTSLYGFSKLSGISEDTLTSAAMISDVTSKYHEAMINDLHKQEWYKNASAEEKAMIDNNLADESYIDACIQAYQNESGKSPTYGKTAYKVTDILKAQDTFTKYAIKNSTNTRVDISPWGCPALEKYYEFDSEGNVLVKGHTFRRYSEKETREYEIDFKKKTGPIFFYHKYDNVNGSDTINFYEVTYSSGKYNAYYINLSCLYTRTESGVVTKQSSDNRYTFWCDSWYVNVPQFSSFDEGLEVISSLLKGQSNDLTAENLKDITNNTVSTGALVSEGAFGKVLQGHDYVTVQELKDILNKMSTGKYQTVNEYVTDARQSITNNYNQTVNEGDKVVNEGDTIINNNYTSTYDDSRLLGEVSAVGSNVGSINNKLDTIIEEQKSWGITDFFKSVILHFTAIFVKLQEWDFSSWFTKLFDDIYNLPYAMVKVFAATFDWDFENWFANIISPLKFIVESTSAFFDFCYEMFNFDEILGKLSSWLFPEWFAKLFGILEGWTFANWWDALLEKLGMYFKVVPDFLSDILTGVKSLVKAIPEALEKIWEGVISIPDSIADVLAEIKAIVIPDVAVIATHIPSAETMFNISFPTGIFSHFNSYSHVIYPVIAIDTPDILRQFYSSNRIVLCDFGEYKTICADVRSVLAWVLRVGLSIWFVKHFRLHLSAH